MPQALAKRDAEPVIMLAANQTKSKPTIKINTVEVNIPTIKANFKELEKKLDFVIKRFYTITSAMQQHNKRLL